MSRPEIADAPGLVWKPRKAGWEARWQADAAVVRSGYSVKGVALWKGHDPNDEDRKFIARRCGELQQWMLDWKAARTVKPATYDGMLHSLIACYQTDPVSNYVTSLTHKVRENYDSLLKRLLEDRGSARIAEIRFRDLKEWHLDWVSGGHVSMAHSLVSMLRTLIRFGSTILEDEACIKVAVILSGMKFKMAPRPKERMTIEMVEKFIAVAHREGFHSIAFAEAIKCNTGLRQKDVIGERVPIGDKNFPPTEFIYGNEKWGRGAIWPELDANLVFTHVTSKKQKLSVIPFQYAPLIMAEFARIGALPDTGPMIICEQTGEPWRTHEYRKQFRILARLAGIPDNVKSMHTRAGFISRATQAGADIEKIRQTVGHTDAATTAGYSRADVENTETVMLLMKEQYENKAGKSARTK